LVERDLHIVPQVGATFAARAAAAATPAHAEQVVEDVREGRCKVGAKAGRAAPHSLFEGGMSETVVGCALLRILEDLVRFADFLEAVFTLRVAGIAIGMVL